MLRIYLLLALLATVAVVNAQQGTVAGSTIEGFWQDIAGRTLYKRNASPTDIVGAWHPRDVGLPYFDTKLIRKSAAGYEMLDMRYGADYAINVVGATEKSIEYVRTTKWSGCRMNHKCNLDGAELYCAIENVCRPQGVDVVEWRGEERYARRSHCEQLDGEQAQGIPTRCR